MATIDGVMAGFILGTLQTAGVWAFVESQSSSGPDVPVTSRVPHLPAVAVPQEPQPPVEAAMPSGATGTRSSPRPAARAARATVSTDVRGETQVPHIVQRSGATGPASHAPAATDSARAARVAVGERRLAVSVGTGIEMALDRELGSAAQWNLQLHLESNGHMGYELGYVATVGPHVRADSIEALAKLYPLTNATTRPYVLAGLGWRRFHSPVDVDVATAPLGVGLELRSGSWRADTRLTFRPAGKAGFRTLGATARVGWAF